MGEPIERFGGDVIAWAYSDQDSWPMQDWDLLLADPRDGALLLRLASDLVCQTRAFFLHCLSILIGDSVRVLATGVRIPFRLMGF